MSIPFQCECGRAYDFEHEHAFRTIHCPKCRTPIDVPMLVPSANAAAVVATRVQAMPATAQPRRVPGQDTVAGDEGRLEAMASDAGPVDESPSGRRRLGRSDLVLGGGAMMMVLAALWYFIGFRLFGGPRLYPAVALLVTGLLFLIRSVEKGMEH
jgi:hypothetical protein